ncbi:unnamed protein product [Cuscuta europaea]|uniref:Ribosomal protein L34Ae n=1 Tax=Cuscuta europaea TaxID=41803 RepID=A0A9P1EMW7_CUSEU|nr:unnamed protein product [Cuscuta europaea]
MDFLKLKKFCKAYKQNPEIGTEDKLMPRPEEIKNSDGQRLGNPNQVNSNNVETEDDDDDFITNEVKRRLKELRRNSFMVLIPEEETSPEDGEEDEEEQEEGDNSLNQWRDVEAEGRQFWSGFDAVYNKYCERMLFYDQLRDQQLREFGSHVPSKPSPMRASKRLASPFRCLSLKNIDEPEDETEHLHKPGFDPYHDLETAYVAQLCLTWEILHCQYTQLSQKIAHQPESSTSYNHSAQQFQQFLVLLQRFIENEPFEHGLRPEIYARSRRSFSKLLQVPKVEGCDLKKSEEDEILVLAPDLIKIIESSIITYRKFLKLDNKKTGGVRYRSHNEMAMPLQQIQFSLEKKAIKLKDSRKRSKKRKQQMWPSTAADVDLLLGLIDVKVMARVLRMEKITKEHLFWCEEKMKKLDVSDGKFHRDPTILLFPC